MTSFREHWDDLTDDEKTAVLTWFDEIERARVFAEWETDGRAEHECDPLDTYCGGCSVCGLPPAGRVTP